MIRFHLKLPFLVVGDFGIDAIITKREKEREREKNYGQRESNLEGICNKTVRVFFLPKFSTLQL